MPIKKIYVGATRQNRGKTVFCLGIIDALIKRGYKVGFIKPVGQRYVIYNNEQIDEDAILVKQIFGCDCNLKDTSPIAIEKDFTKKYILGKAKTKEELSKKIIEAFDRVSKNKDIVIVEGTGHAGVGGVFDLPNPYVAKILDLKAIIVSSGGIGKPIDEIILNKAFFEKEGVEVIGAVVNKVKMEKYDKISELVKKGLSRQGIRILGILPFVPLLSYLSMDLILEILDGELIAGEDNLHLFVEKIIIGAMSSHDALNHIENRTLIITPGDREDIILAALSSSLLDNKKEQISGLILTGGLMPHKSIIELIKKVRANLIENSKSFLEQIINKITKIRLISMHTDISTVTGERVILFILAENLEEKFK